MKVVIDTNVIVSAISPFSPYHFIFSQLQMGKFTLLISTEIYLEYLEIMQKRSKKENVVFLQGIVLYTDHVEVVEPNYRWNLIVTDEDDNKFVDCAIAGNANYLVTTDRHFDLLKSIPFPSIALIHPDDFLKILKNE